MGHLCHGITVTRKLSRKNAILWKIAAMYLYIYVYGRKCAQGQSLTMPAKMT